MRKKKLSMEEFLELSDFIFGEDLKDLDLKKYKKSASEQCTEKIKLRIELSNAKAINNELRKINNKKKKE